MSLLHSIEQRLPPGYSIDCQLGSGATSWVYVARNAEDGGTLAVKVLHPGLGREIEVDRFRREIEILRTLDHPRIVRLLEAGEADGTLYYTMPYLEGGSLRARLRRDATLPLREALGIARDIADALAHVHARGMVHRDVKPENILLGNGHAYLIDFGFTRAPSLTSHQMAALDAQLAIGTPGYISPEQLSGKQIQDWRSDLFSLACVLQEMLTGRQPFGAEAWRATGWRAAQPTPEDLQTARPEVPDDVAAIVRRNLAPSPNDRFATAGFLRLALEAVIARFPEPEPAT